MSGCVGEEVFLLVHAKNEINRWTLLCSVDRMFYPLLALAIYHFVGPWCIGYLTDGKFGAIFLWGTVIGGSYLLPDAQFLLGVSSGSESSVSLSGWFDRWVLVIFLRLSVDLCITFVLLSSLSRDSIISFESSSSSVRLSVRLPADLVNDVDNLFSLLVVSLSIRSSPSHLRDVSRHSISSVDSSRLRSARRRQRRRTESRGVDLNRQIGMNVFLFDKSVRCTNETEKRWRVWEKDKRHESDAFIEGICRQMTRICVFKSCWWFICWIGMIWPDLRIRFTIVCRWDKIDS